MNELNINLTQTPVAKATRIFFGIIFLIMAISWTWQVVFSRGYSSGFNNMHGLDIFYITMNVFVGIIHLLIGSGVNVFGRIGKAYIKIGTSTIRIKKSNILKEVESCMG